jgi:O-antigen/teichoic acid export membrane protein
MLQKYYHTHKETAHNFFWRSMQIFGKQAISFFIFIFCVTFLSPDDFGVYSYIMGFGYLLIVFSDFGIGQTVLRRVASCDPNDTMATKNILYNSVILVLVTATVVWIIAIIVGKMFLSEYFYYILLISPLIFLAPLTSLYDGFLGGLKRFKEQSIIFTKSTLISAPIIVLCVWYGGIVGAILGHIIFYAFLLIGLWRNNRLFEVAYDRDMFRNIFSYTMLIGLASISYLLYTKINVVILGWFGFVSQIGYYEIMNKIFYIALLLPINILATITAPNIVRYFEQGRFKMILQKAIQKSSIIFVLGICISLVTFFVFPYLFRSMLPQYDINLLMSMLQVMFVLVPIKLVSTYINTAYIIPGGYAKILTYTVGIFGLVNVALSIIFLNIFGFIGIMYAMVIAQGVESLVSVLIFMVALKKKIYEKK